MEFGSTRTVKSSRKDKKCYWCGEKIPKGSPCVYISGKFDGDFFTMRNHNECESASQEWMKLNRDQDYPWEGEMVRGKSCYKPENI